MKKCLSQCRQLYIMHGCSAAIYNHFKATLPQCGQAFTRAYIIYIIYREVITAIFRIKMLAVNIS